MKKEELLSIGLTEEQADKVFAMNGKDIEKHKKAAEDAKADKEAVEKQLADRDKDIEDLQGRYTKETEDYKAQLASRDYADAMNRAITANGVKFSSKAAEKAYLADLKEKHLELKDGELTGFDEWHKAQLEADPTAFQSDKPAPTFVKPVGQGGAPAAKSKGAMYAQQFNAQFAQTPNKE